MAVALAESAGNTCARGDTALTGGVWGPSVGLWQIRSITTTAGTGGTRDATANRAPAVNAKHAYRIWKAHGWRAWSTWLHGTWKHYL